MGGAGGSGTGTVRRKLGAQAREVRRRVAAQSSVALYIGYTRRARAVVRSRDSPRTIHGCTRERCGGEGGPRIGKIDRHRKREQEDNRSLLLYI
jgi:hypothetical protein